MRRPRTLGMLAVVMILSGCNGPQPGPFSTPSASRSGGSRSSALPAGLLVISQEGNPDLWVFAPDTGQLIEQRSIRTQEVQPDEISRANISADGRYVVGTMGCELWAADGRYVVGTMGCELWAAEYDGRGTYMPMATWTPPQPPGQNAQCFDRPAFDKTNKRVRIVIGPPNLQENVTAPGAIMTVDLMKPSEPAVQLSDPAPPLRESRIRVVGASGEGSMFTWGAEIDSLSLRIEGAANGRWSDYECRLRVDEVILLCYQTSHLAADAARFGSVALATVDRAAATVRLRQIAPPALKDVEGAVLSPDQSTVLFKTDEGWHRVKADGSGAPQFVFRKLAAPGPLDPDGNLRAVSLEWIES